MAQTVPRQKNTFDSKGKLTERLVEYSGGKWKQEFFNMHGDKTTLIEFDGVAKTTTVFDKRGRVVASTEEL